MYKIENYRIDVGINQQSDGIFGSDNEWSQPGLAVSKMITHPSFIETLYPKSSIYAGYLTNLLYDVVLFKLAV